MREISGLLAASGNLAIAFAALRWAALAGFVLLTGAAVCTSLCRPTGAAGQAVGRLMTLAWVSGSVGVLGLLLLPGPLPELTVRMRTALLLLLAVTWILGRRYLAAPEASRLRRLTGAAIAALLTLTACALWYVAELPAAMPLIPALAIAEAAQLTATAIWLGGSSALACMLIAGHGAGPTLDAARRFAPAALVSLHLLMATVSMQMWQSIGAAPALLGTGYGQLMLAQVGALTLLLALDALTRACLQHGPQAPLDAAAETAGRSVRRVVLHRALAAQLAIGAMLFAIAGPLPLLSPGIPMELLTAG